MKPLCKCGKVCQHYGPIGGYSASCKGCNEKHAKWQRERREKLRDPVVARAARRKEREMQRRRHLKGTVA
ncbi:MAG: hypothetical protein RB191_19850 [Terriglobia bacterium]|nr:hypothetical protein [Terriglobia bacterium]